MFRNSVEQDGIVEVTDISEKQESKGRPPGLNTVNLLKVLGTMDSILTFEWMFCSFHAVYYIRFV